MQVLGQVLKSVTALHAAGYAHRNIKPSNILQRGKQHDWMLFDFSASCPIGAPLLSACMLTMHMAWSTPCCKLVFSSSCDILIERFQISYCCSASK
ncbi:MAG: hypothetical protein HC767_01035 [Akkermansiaceae bacterium]|nr:hypothetical protein [Akkermansiaceae bacterium]